MNEPFTIEDRVRLEDGKWHFVTVVGDDGLAWYVDGKRMESSSSVLRRGVGVAAGDTEGET